MPRPFPLFRQPGEQHDGHDAPGVAQLLRSSPTARRLAVLISIVLALVLGYVGLQGCGLTPERNANAFCGRLTEVGDIGTSLASFDNTALRKDLGALESLRSSSPTEIEPDVAIIFDTMRLLLIALEPPAGAAPSPVPPDADEAERQRVEKVWRTKRSELDRISAASQAVSTYAKNNCGVDLNPLGPAPVAPPQTVLTPKATGTAVTGTGPRGTTPT